MAKYNLSQLQSLSRQAGWPESLIAKAAAIWMYESGGNPNAHNPRGENSWGLAQINLPFHPTMNAAKAQDPITALTYAYKLYRARPDWGDWYNSNKKYNANFQGIAAQSRAIYSNGGDSGTPVSNSIVNTVSANTTSAAGIGTRGIFIVALVGLGALLILGQREQY